MHGDEQSRVATGLQTRVMNRPVVGSRYAEPRKWAATRRTGISLAEGMPLSEWQRIGRHIFVIADSSAWWLGDWVIYGQSNYPDRYRVAMAETSLDYQTLRNYAWVARKFPPARRRERLSFQHHAEVAGLPTDEQDEWLDRAERDRLTRSDLRNQIRNRRRSDEATGAALVQVSVTAGRHEQWRLAADLAGMSLPDWVIMILDGASGGAGEVPSSPELGD